MKFNMASIKAASKMAEKAIVKNAPTILTICGAVGAIGSVIMCGKATIKACEIVREKEPETKLDVVKETWKLYIPTVTMTAASVACIVASNRINAKRLAGIASAYALSESAFKRYREATENILGDDEQKVIDQSAMKVASQNPVPKNDVIMTGDGDIWCYDCLSGQKFKSDRETIRRIQNDINQCIVSGDGFASQNEFYSQLGLNMVKMGDSIGWTVDHLLDLSFSGQLDDNGRPILVMDYKVTPRPKLEWDY